MAKKERAYIKLPGVKKGFLLGRYTLWQGGNHLLHIYSRLGVEDYKRFYYADVQAIVARKTVIGKLQNAVLTCFAVLFGLPALGTTGGWALFFFTAAGGMLLFLMYNLWRGPTCETHLLTAVQTERLHCLHRFKQAAAVMDRLRPYIKQAQGELSAEDLKKNPAIYTRKPIRRPSVRQPRSGTASPVHEKGGAHRILFFLLLLNGIVVIPGFWMNHVALTIAGSMALLATGIFVVIALVRQHGSDMARPLQVVTWVSLGFVGICMAAAYVFSIALAIKNPQIGYNQWTLWKSMASLSPRDNALIMGLDIFMLCGSALLGLTGLMLLKKAGVGVKAKAVAAAVAPQSTAKKNKSALGVKRASGN